MVSTSSSGSVTGTSSLVVAGMVAGAAAGVAGVTALSVDAAGVVDDVPVVSVAVPV